LGAAEVIIDWDTALRALREATGMPVLIGLELVPEDGVGAAASSAPVAAAASGPDLAR